MSNDSDLHQRFQTSEWVDLYGDYLYRYAMMRLKDSQLAEDMVQETFLAALKNLHQFDGRVEVKFWLRGILRNKVVDHIRKSIRRNEVLDQGDDEFVGSLLFKTSGIPTRNPKPWAFNADDAFAQEEFWDAFRACIEKLKEPAKQAFTLKMVEEVSTEEICKELDIEPNYLWVLLHRARGQLKSCLEHNWSHAAS